MIGIPFTVEYTKLQFTESTRLIYSKKVKQRSVTLAVATN